MHQNEAPDEIQTDFEPAVVTVPDEIELDEVEPKDEQPPTTTKEVTFDSIVEQRRGSEPHPKSKKVVKMGNSPAMKSVASPTQALVAREKFKKLLKRKGGVPGQAPGGGYGDG